MKGWSTDHPLIIYNQPEFNGFPHRKSIHPTKEEAIHYSCSLCVKKGVYGLDVITTTKRGVFSVSNWGMTSDRPEADVGEVSGVYMYTKPTSIHPWAPLHNSIYT